MIELSHSVTWKSDKVLIRPAARSKELEKEFKGWASYI